MNETNFKVNVRTSADTAGIDKTKAAVAEMKGEFDRVNAQIDAALDAVRNKAAKSTDAATGGLGGKVKGADFGSFLGLPSMADAPALMAQAARLGKMIGDGLARGIESVSRGGSFLGGILGDYDPTQDEGLQRLMQSYRDVIKSINAKPEAGGIIEWLDQVKVKAREAVEELKHLEELRKSDEQGRRSETDSWMDSEKRAIQEDQTLSPEQKLEANADLERRRIMEQQKRNETDRLAKETAAQDEISIKRQELDAAKTAEDTLKKRAEVSARAGLSAQGAWSATDEGKGIGETLSSGLPKLTFAEPMPESYRRNYIAREGERNGLQDLVDPTAESKAFEEARNARKAKEDELKQAEESARRVREVNVSEANNDATDASRKMAGIDQNLERERAKLPTPDPAVGQAAQEGSQAMQEGANDAAQSMRQLANSAEQSFSTMKSAVAEAARAAQAAQQAAQQALEEARAAKQSAESNRRGARY